jgi:outer membrane protein OmpA-like peptidoglycan-associated protein
MIRPIALALVLAIQCLGAAAQTTLYYREGERVEPQDVKRILEGPPAGTTRSIRLLQEAGSDDSKPAEPAAGSHAPSALALPVQFAFDSAAILPGAREQLDQLAEGIKLLPRERVVVIEGHTDARGSDDYNDLLSLRRAEAVKDYLVEHHGIDAARLREVGFGKRQPIADLDPFAAANRRVQFHGG